MNPKRKKRLRKRSNARVKGHGLLQTTCVDITERRKMEEELKNREERYRSLFQNSRDAICITTPDGKFIDFNEAWLDLFGYGREEMLRLGVREIYADPASREKFLQEMRRKGFVKDYELKVRRKDGAERDCLLTSAPWRASDETVLGYQGILRDMTERKRIEKELAESEQNYRDLTDNAAVGMTTVDMKGRFTYVNRVMADFIGHSVQDLMGHPFKDYIHPEDRGRITRLFFNIILLRRTPKEVELRAMGPDGTVRHLLMRPSRIRVGRKTVGFSAVMIDITERRRMEEVLKQSEAKLKALHRHTRELAVAKTLEEVAKHTLDVMEFTLGFDVADFCTVEKGHILVHGSRGIQAAPKLWEWPLEGPGLVVKSVETKKTLRVPDTKKEPSFVDRRTFSGTEKLQLSELAVPVLLDNTVVGVLNVESSELNAFTDEDQELLETLATHVASALGRLRQVDTLEELVEERTRELKESEEKYRLLVDNMTDIVFAIDLKGNITFCSQAGEKMTGYSVRQLLSMNMKEVIAQEHLAEIQERLQARMKGEKNLPRHEFEIIRADGKRLPVEMSTSPLLKEGHLVGIQGIVRDITERKRAEEDLRESEEKFRRIYNASLDAIYTTSIDGKILDMNPAGVVMFGFDSLDELKKVNIESLYVNLDDRKRLVELAGKGPVRDFRVQFKRKDGTVIDCIINSYPLNDERGRIVGLQGAIIDVSEHQQFQKKLEESEERFRGIAERSFDMIAMLDMEGRISYASPAVTWVTGYTPEEMVGQHFQNYLPKDVIPKEIQAFVEIAKGGVSRAVQLRIVRKDGSLAQAEVNASPTIIDGKITGVQAIIRDVTERYAIERMRDRFISAVTHELRTPLVSMKGYVDLALSAGPGQMSQKVESRLQVAKRNTDRLLSLVNDLLDVQRMQAERLQLEIQPTDFNKVVDSCMAEIQPLLEERKLSLRLEVPEGELRIEGDQARLCQALMNLLSNAAKFSPEGSEVTLHVEEENESIKVQVSDRGIGIRKEDLERVFEPFAAIEKPDYVKGTGLGLSITKGLVEAHGGRIWAESEGEGKGATFSFTIPKRKEVV